MTVLTIYNHGTGYGRQKGIENDELVAWMHEHTVGEEARIVNGQLVGGDFIINDGPGSGSDRAGVYNPFTGLGKGDETFKYGKGHGKRSEFARGFAGQTETPSNLSGNISGSGWDDVVARSVFLVVSLIEAGRDITTVNLAGWSRGAVLCIRIANKLYEVFGRDIRVNIFGVDPVAGMQNGVNMEDTRVIPANVRYCCLVLALHERRRTFKPQDLSRIHVEDADRTRLTYLPMPGVHGGQVMVDQGGRTSSHITRALGMAVMSHFGTRFDSAPIPYLNSSVAMTQAYAHMHNHLDAYKDHETSGLKNRLIGGGLRRRSFARSENLSHYVTGGKGSYWINEHHRACFKRAFPTLYRDIFGSRGDRLINLNGYGDAAHYLRSHTTLRKSLVAHDMLVELNGSWQVVEGAGIYDDHGVAEHIRRWPGALPLHP